MPDHEAIEFHLINELVEPQRIDPGKKTTCFRLHRESRPTRFGRPLSGQKPPAERFVDDVLEAPVVAPSHAGECFGKIVVEGQRRTHEKCSQEAAWHNRKHHDALCVSRQDASMRLGARFGARHALNSAAADMLAWENSGFSIDASVRITLLDRDVPSYFRILEHLLRYCARPPFALERLSVIRSPDGRITRIGFVLPRHKAANWVGPGRGRKSTRPGPMASSSSRRLSSSTGSPISSRRRSHPLVARPPTGASSFKPITTETRFRRRPTSCPRSIAAASDRCRTRGINEAAKRPDSKRFCPDG